MACEDCRKPANSSHRGASRRWSSASNATNTMIAINAQVAMRRGTLGRRRSAARAIDSLAAFEQVDRHALEPRAGEPLADALPQALERLHDAGPIEATVHRH